MPKPLTVWITTNCGKFFKRWEDQTTLPTSWEICIQVKKRHGTTDWFQIGKGARQGCVFSPCLFNLYAEYIMQNAGLGEPQVGIKTAGRNYTSLAMQSLYWHPEIYGALLSFSKVYLFFNWRIIALQINIFVLQFSSVQSLSCVRHFVTPWTAAC